MEGWRRQPWHAKPNARIFSMRQLEGLEGLGLARSKEYPGAFGIEFLLQPAGVPRRKVRIFFNDYTPHVHVDGPGESPHRWANGALCLSYPDDPPEAKWKLRDGLQRLVADVGAHLIKEEWWRLVGEWPGPEMPHGRLASRGSRRS